MNFSHFKIYRAALIWGCICMLIGCAPPNDSPQPASGGVPFPQTETLSETTAPAFNQPLWALYNAPNQLFSIEYPTNWSVVAPDTTSPADGALWSFSGTLVSDTGTSTADTNTISIGRQIMPIAENQKLADWVSLYGRGELTKDVIEQQELQINGKDAYFQKTSTTVQGLSQETFIRCKSEVWFIANLIDKPTQTEEFDKTYSYMVNTFMLPCL